MCRDFEQCIDSRIKGEIPLAKTNVKRKISARAVLLHLASLRQPVLGFTVSLGTQNCNLFRSSNSK